MIVFEGDVSHNARLYMKQIEGNVWIIVSIIVLVLFGVPLLMFCIYASALAALFYIVLPMPLLGGVLYRFLPTDLQKVQMPTKVMLMQDIMISKGKDFEYGRYYDDVKKVIDCGEWYHIVFYFPHKNVYFICQKDLIKEGTIEEFEEIFKDKIVRKKQKGDNGHEKI